MLCPTRALAVEAAKRLLAENAHRFDVNIRIEAEVRSELEHLSLGDERRDDGDGGDRPWGEPTRLATGLFADDTAGEQRAGSSRG